MVDWSAFTWKAYNFPLSLGYLTIVLICVFQIGRILYYKHKLLGFQVWFLLLCLVWASMRAIFFALLNVWSLTPFVVLFWLPYWLQFATFAFLALFYYATMYYNHVTREHAARVTQLGVLLFAAVNVLLLALLGVLVGLDIASGSAASVRLLIRLVRLLLVLMWALLIGLLAVYGWRVAQLLSAGRLRVPFHPRSLSARAVNALTCALVLVFASRAVFDLVTIVLANESWLLITSTKLWQQLVLFALYAAWELVPASLVLALFWHIPRTQLRTRTDSTRVAAASAGGYAPNPTSPLLDPTASAGSVNSLGPAPAFGSTGGRYDSDDSDGESAAPAAAAAQGQSQPQQLPAAMAAPAWYGSIERLRGQWRTFNTTGTHSPHTYTAAATNPMPGLPPAAAPAPPAAQSSQPQQ